MLSHLAGCILCNPAVEVEEDIGSEADLCNNDSNVFEIDVTEKYRAINLLYWKFIKLIPHNKQN